MDILKLEVQSALRPLRQESMRREIRGSINLFEHWFSIKPIAKFYCRNWKKIELRLR